MPVNQPAQAFGKMARAKGETHPWLPFHLSALAIRDII